MAKVFNVMQYLNHPVTNEPLISEENILGLIEYRSIKKYAYILHDKDKFTKADEMDYQRYLVTEYKKLCAEEQEMKSCDEYVKENNWKKAGKRKPPHYHLVVYSSKNMDVDKLAMWLKIKPQYIDIPKGKNDKLKFYDCVKYLTHESEKEQKKKKYLYEDSEVICNFDFREYLDDVESKGMEKSAREKRDEYRRRVLYEGLTINGVISEDPDAYMNDMIRLDKCRAKYLAEQAQMPPLRINIYIDGAGGIGKNTASKALARSLYPGLESEDTYFEVGGENTSFEGYDGQPVVIWNDFRAVDLIMRFGRGELFDMFDSHPTGARHNIKYGSVSIINTINIINGIETYKDFLNGLSGEYTDRAGNKREAEDKTQAYRRFPIIICLRESDFDVFFNKGVFENTREFLQYECYKHMVGSFANVAKKLDGEAKEKVMLQMCTPVKEKVEELKNQHDDKITSIDEIPEEFKRYGKDKNDNWEDDWD